jgi:hypothetical protein
MFASERAFVLRAAADCLVSGGRLVVADETHASGGWRRAGQVAWRVPQLVLAWLLVGTVSHPIADLAGEVRATGLCVRSERTWLMGSLRLVVAERAS